MKTTKSSQEAAGMETLLFLNLLGLSPSRQVRFVLPKLLPNKLLYYKSTASVTNLHVVACRAFAGHEVFHARHKLIMTL